MCGGPSLKQLLYLFVVLFKLSSWVLLASAEFENSWIMYKEQPCCGTNTNHHVRHHRGELPVQPCGLFIFYESISSIPGHNLSAQVYNVKELTKLEFG